MQPRIGMKDCAQPVVTGTGVNAKSNRDKEIQTIIFNAFVFCQVFNEINARKPENINVFDGLHKNHLFLFVMLFTCTTQALIVEFAGDFASTVGLDWKMWILCVVLGFISMPLAAAVKYIPVPDAPYSTYLTPWRHPENQIVISQRGTITALLVGQKGEEEEFRFRKGPQGYEAVIDGETVRVPMPPYLPPPTEPFLERLRYAFFPSYHDMPGVTSASTNPKANVAWI